MIKMYKRMSLRNRCNLNFSSKSLALGLKSNSGYLKGEF